MVQIVTVNVSTQNAPQPNTLQQTAAFISRGATNLAPNTLQALTTPSSLTSLLNQPVGCGITQTAGTATITLNTGTWGITNGQQVLMVIAGCTQTQYNGTFLVTITSTTQGTYSVSGSPSSPATGTPTVVAWSTVELTQMNNTWWAQGTSVPVNVLELGPGDTPTGITSFSSWLAANLLRVYSWVVPREWDVQSGFLSLIAQYESNTSQVYFFTTTTTSNYASYTPQMKDVFAVVEAPGILATEFTAAAMARALTARNPSSGNKVGPFAFTQLFGTTPYPQAGNSTILAALKAAFTNVDLVGSEGGLTNLYTYWGTTKDGNDFTYWYALDWMQINLKQTLAATILNGSNNPLNPLIYNQAGVNRLQDAVYSILQQSQANGLGNGQPVRTALTSAAFAAAIDAGTFAGQIVVNAQPLAGPQGYAALNPNDYASGTYNGLSVLFTPSRGFTSILINLVAVNFI